jgi:hypothetical protein
MRIDSGHKMAPSGKGNSKSQSYKTESVNHYMITLSGRTC